MWYPSSYRATALLLMVPLLAACSSDDVTGVVVNATVRVVLDDNPTRTIPPVSGVQETPPPGEYEGTLAATARVAISADGGVSWHEVIGTKAITVPLQVGDSAQNANVVSVPAATYSKVRLTLRGASLTVSGEVPGGRVINKTLDVTALEVVIVRDIPAITLSASTSARLAFDLNSESWLTAASVSNGEIAESLVEGAVGAVAGYDG